MGSVDPCTYTLSSNESVLVRTAAPDDAAGIIHVMKDVFEERDYHLSVPDDFKGTEEEQQAWIQKFIDDPGKLMLVAEKDGVVVAVLEFENDYRQRMKHRGTVWISILRDMRSRDLGTALGISGWRWVQNNPLIEKVYMHVLHTNTRSLGLCKKMGFVEEARLHHDVKLGPGQYADVVILSQHARPHELAQVPPVTAPSPARENGAVEKHA
ncbi:GNAT family N-acetyltransferase [Pendulispora albinea]|uniref:GNAT family N-acetyltransferase n=1 Tax=Pendulispora albinea TaxID=2741071 RepID=A0ABZ2M5K8_9BACT